MRCPAHGLLLDSSFPIHGVFDESRPDARELYAAELPRLSLARRGPEDIDALWSGADGSHPWRGLLGDGLELTIEHGLDDDLLFSYGERARFRLTPEKLHLDCAPEHDGLDWQRALIGKVLPCISVMRGYEALHAAVVADARGAVAIMGKRGMGKSTLAAELIRRGWSLFADDQLTLERLRGEVRAHPGTSHMNLAMQLPAGLDSRAIGATLGILAGERWLAAERTSHCTVPVRLLVLLEREDGLSLMLNAAAPGPLTLAPYMLGWQEDVRRQRERFLLYGDLVESAVVVRLTAGARDTPGRLADLVEQQISSQTCAVGATA